MPISIVKLGEPKTPLSLLKVSLVDDEIDANCL